MTSSIFAASCALRQIGPVRMLRPAPIIPFRLTSSSVGASPTRLLTDAGHRIDTTVSSPIAQVTRFAATELAEPALDIPGSRSVSYGLQSSSEGTASAVGRILGQVCLRQNDRAGIPQPLDERGILRRAV